MPRKVQDRGLYLRESSERAGDLLLMACCVHCIVRFTLSASSSFSCSLSSAILQSVYSDMCPSLYIPALLSLFIHSFPSLTFSSRIFFSLLLFHLFFLFLMLYIPHLTFLFLHFPVSFPSSCLPLFLQSFALFDWSLSLDSPGCIQVKLLIASVVGGLRHWLTAAQPVPVQGAAGLLGGMSCSVLVHAGRQRWEMIKTY